MKLSTTGSALSRKGRWWTIALSKKDGIDEDIVQFLDKEPFNLRHIEPLSKFYAEIEFNKAQEGISPKQVSPPERAAQPRESPATVVPSGWTCPCGTSFDVAAMIPPPMLQTGPHPAGGHDHSHDIANDFQDLLGDIVGSTLGYDAGEREGVGFDEDLAKCLLDEMATAPCPPNEAAANPESVPPTAAKEAEASSTENHADAAWFFLNTLELQDLLKELEDPPL